jgi:glycosyltransferase involved in cell wall biosynthesis
MNKVCDTLHSSHFEITLIGRKLPDSPPIKRPYKIIRIPLLFGKGFLFYAEYNLRLFFKLLYLKKDILLSNDLDTLLPNFLISRFFNKKLVYDSHEIFTEVSELKDRFIVRNIWLAIEASIFPKLKNVYTVNKRIALFYKEKYNVDIKVVRNIAPILSNKKIDLALANKIKGSQKMLILQGAGINIERGAEEAIKMMQYLDNTILYIIGGGDVFDELKALVIELHLKNKVCIKERMPYNELLEYTKIADLGLNLDKGTNLNYEYSLPNKVFDYIQCQIPILTSNRKVVSDLVYKNDIGIITQSHDPKKLAEIVNSIFKDKNRYAKWKENLKTAAKIYTWENESTKLIEIFSKLN